MVAAPTMYPPTVWTMPLGGPVLPLVNRQNSGSSASTHTTSHVVGCPCRASSHHTSRPGVIGTASPPAGRLPLATTICDRTVWPLSRAAIATASSATALRSIHLAPRRTPSQVTITAALAATRRPARATGEKPPNTTECTAPMRAAASITVGSSTPIGMYVTTASPRRTPAARSAWAVRHTSASSAAYVTDRARPSSGSLGSK